MHRYCVRSSLHLKLRGFGLFLSRVAQSRRLSEKYRLAYV